MNNLSVLIVDDSAEFANGLKRIFESMGWSAQTAENQENAKYLFSADAFDLVLVDCFIPGADGFTISKELSGINDETKGSSIFFLMSGILVDDSSKKEALSYPHIKDFVKKPIDLNLLKEKLHEHFPDNEKSIIDFFIKADTTLEQFNIECNQINSLDQVELALLIKQVSELEFSGEIKFTQDETETIVNFNSGEITNVISPNFADSMGELLVGLGYLTRDNLSNYIASDCFKKGEEKIGKALIAKNYISPHAVPLALKEQKKIRLGKLFENCKRMNFQITNRPSFEHDTSISLNTDQITDCIVYFLTHAEADTVRPKHLKLLKGSIASATSISLKDINEKLNSSKEKLAEKHNNGTTLGSEDSLFLIALLACRGLVFSSAREDTAVSSAERQLIKEKLHYLNGKIKLETPYEVLGLNPDNITDQRASKKYQHLAKELHPDKLNKMLNPDELEEAKRIFSEVTKAFNSIKTTENRRTYESLKANQEAQDKVDCNNLLEKAKKALHASQYSEAIKLLDQEKMHKNQPNEFGLYLLWASFKSKGHQLNQNPRLVLEEEHKNLKNEPLYYYLKAILANKNNDMQSFQKFIGLSLKADSHFLPARRELQIVRSQRAKVEPEKKSWFSFKKTS